MAALPAEPADLGHRDPLHPDLADGLPHIVEFERLDNRCDELHRPASPHLVLNCSVYPRSGSKISTGCAIGKDLNVISGLAFSGGRAQASLHRMGASLRMRCVEMKRAYFKDSSSRTLPS
jgi:hypothetical protein